MGPFSVLVDTIAWGHTTKEDGMQIRRIVGVVAVTTVGFFVGMMGLAWACTAQARIVTASPSAGVPGEVVNVRGEGAAPGSPIEIRWDGVSGKQLASAVADSNGRFQAVATVPDAGSGIYSLVVAAGDAGLARTSFEISSTDATGTESVPASPALWNTGAATEVSSSPSGSDTALMVGTALLAVGVVGLFSGFTIAALGRRREQAAGRDR